MRTFWVTPDAELLNYDYHDELPAQTKQVLQDWLLIEKSELRHRLKLQGFHPIEFRFGEAVRNREAGMDAKVWYPIVVRFAGEAPGQEQAPA